MIIKNYKICVCCLYALLICSTSGAQINELISWLDESELNRQPLSTLNFSKIPLSRADAKLAQELLFADKKASMLVKYDQQWNGREIIFENFRMPFFYQKFGAEPQDGRSLFISMHGGGATAPSVNDQQYENQKFLYNATMNTLEGVYLAARAPTNTWNLWHQSHIDDFFNIIIQLAVIKENVNPNKVYIMGYSAGGDGVYQLAPRMADRWAAASMMAGHPNESTPLGLRNTPFTIHMGALDSGFNRNIVAQQWGNALNELQSNDTNGYIHSVNIYEGLGHWMQLRDAVALPWMKNFTRNPIPEKIVWKQDDVHHSSFYWLETPSNLIQTSGEVIAQYDKVKNEINIIKNYSSNIKLLINDDMLDLDSPISIKYQNNIIHQGVFYRTILNIQESLIEKGDVNFVFPAFVEVINNQSIIQDSNTLSISDQVTPNLEVSIYPNPVKNSLNITLPKIFSKNNTNIKLINLQGQVLKVFSTNKHENTINISELKKSIYIIRIENSNYVSNYKILKT